jgi:hypothetical protein
MEHIESLPELSSVFPQLAEGDYWEQGTWFTILENEREETCGTAACVAGWATILNGDTIELEFGVIPRVNGALVSLHAQNILGLTSDQADMLFWGDNSKERLRTLVDAFIREAESK